MPDHTHTTRYGGQALVEGVMIRGRSSWAVALRHPDGTIVGESGGLPSPSGWRTWPVLRGIATLGAQFSLGWQLLTLSNAVATFGERRRMPRSLVLFTWAVALTIGSLVFVALPLFATPRLEGDTPFARLAEGAIKLVLLAGYVVLVTRLPQFRRLFSYHGAEHMAVHAHEAGVPLTVENVARFNPAHPRCGTAFLLILGVVDGLVLALLPRYGIVPDLALRVTALPLFGGLAYEVLRYGAYRPGIAGMLNRLGVASQRLTTAYPDAGQMEVAVAALQLCMAAEGQPAAADAPHFVVRPIPEPVPMTPALLPPGDAVA